MSGEGLEVPDTSGSDHLGVVRRDENSEFDKTHDEEENGNWIIIIKKY